MIRKPCRVSTWLSCFLEADKNYKTIVIASEAWQSQAIQSRSVSRGLPRFARNDDPFLDSFLL